MKTSTLLATIIASLLPNASSFAADCHQPGNESGYLWTSPVSMNDIYPSHPSGGPLSWTFAQQRYFYRLINLNTPDEACKLWAQYYGGTWSTAQRATIGTYAIDATTYKCAFDCYGNNANGDGVVDDNDFSACPALIDKVQNTDAVCDRVTDLSKVPYPNLYAPSGTHFIPGADFTPTQKTMIKHDNSPFQSIPLVPTYHSDVRNVTGVTEPYPSLYAPLVPVGGPYPEDYPEVDHLIPRVDKYGCGCGTNAPSNALLISRKLNGSMSNDTTNVNRVAIMNYFAP